MAYPQVTGIEIDETSLGGAQHLVTLPAGVVAGELLLMFCRITVVGPCTITGDTGWVTLLDEAPDPSQDQIFVAWKKATGLEPPVVQVNHGAGGGGGGGESGGPQIVKLSGVVYRIAGAADPDVQPPQISSAVVGGAGATVFDAPPLTPVGGARDYLWIYFASASGEAPTPSGDPLPAGYTNEVSASSSGPGTGFVHCRVYTARREAHVALEDPPAWTFTSPAYSGWAAYTVAVFPPGPGDIAIIEFALTPAVADVSVVPLVVGIIPEEEYRTPWTLDDLSALEDAIKSGYRNVRYADKEITYQSLSDMLVLRQYMQSVLGEIPIRVRRTPRMVRVLDELGY